MSRLQPHLMLSHPQRRVTQQVGGIEWEELPSLADALQRRAETIESQPAFRTAWNPTLPAALDPLVESGPYLEPLDGLVTRELREPDVFRHFFF